MATPGNTSSKISEIYSATMQKNPELQIRSFQPGDESSFRELNEAWIGKYFIIEDADRLVLEDPVANILQPGGHILMAIAGTKMIGCCALLANGAEEFELAKMAVLESERGRGLGRKIIERAIEYARSLGAKRLYLETNRKLANAIHLYESVGFRHVSPDAIPPTPYARANVFMEMKLTDSHTGVNLS
jgi:GNAT superfamily N-acetyltransferase